jgi:hypothetical protein
VKKMGERRSNSVYDDGSAPLGGYAGLIVSFGVIVGGILFSRRRELPEKIAPNDLILLGLATQKVSRLVTRSRVAGVLRAPFTEYEGSAGAGEVEEHPRGEGIQRAIGELVSCPFCLGTWVASAGITSLLTRPRLTRSLASIFAVSAIADFFQQAYCRIKEPTETPPNELAKNEQDRAANEEQEQEPSRQRSRQMQHGAVVD